MSLVVLVNAFVIFYPIRHFIQGMDQLACEEGDIRFNSCRL